MKEPEYTPRHGGIPHIIRLISALWILALPLRAQPGSALFERLSLEEGLTQSSVYQVLQDRRGLIWVATQGDLNLYDGYKFRVIHYSPEVPGTVPGNYLVSLAEGPDDIIWAGSWGTGVDRYDRKTGTFRKFRHNPDDPNSLSGDMVRVLLVDPGDPHILWVGTDGFGLNRLDTRTETFERFRREAGKPNSLFDDRVASLLIDHEGFLWVGTMGGGLNRYHKDTDDFSHYRRLPDDQIGALPDDNVLSLFEDGQNRLWVGTGGGLCLFDREAGLFKVFRHISGDRTSLADDTVTAVIESEEVPGDLWVGTNDGLSYFDHKTETFTTFRHNPSLPKSLSHNIVEDLFYDRTGILWVGTYGNGISKLNRASADFNHRQHEPGNPNSLGHNDVLGFYEDASGGLWVGTTGGLNYFHPDSERVTHFIHDGTPDSIANNRVQCFFEDSRGRFWLGTYGGLDLLDRNTGNITHYPHKPGDPTSLSHDHVRVILEDHQGDLWVGTRGGGLNKKTEYGFRAFRADSDVEGGLPHDMVYDLYQDPPERGGEIWIGTRGGLSLFDPVRETFINYRHDQKDKTSLSHNQVMDIHPDPATDGEQLWLATLGGGLNFFNRQTGRFKAYREPDGLPNDVVYGTLSDDRGHLWVSTNKGIARFNPTDETFFPYDRNDGLQSNEFNGGAFMRSASGKMYFGGINGFNVFRPEDLRTETDPPQVMITDLSIFNKSVRPVWEDPESPLDRPVSEISRLVLDHKAYVFSFEFAALHYAAPHDNRYAYMLEGFDQDWINTGADKRFATYTSLAPDTYTFRVKAANKDGVWSEEDASIQVVILPHPLRSKPALAVYVLCLILLARQLWIHHKRKLERERRIQMERMEAQREHRVVQRLKQVDKLKDEFLANTSHELRTPLNGIIGLTESLIDGVAGELSPKARYNLTMIAASGKRLASLVNDILDFSKLQNKSLELHTRAVDLSALTDVVVTLLRPLIGKRDLVLENCIPPNLPPVLADENRLQQILHNLVGNAVKFTEKGRVDVTAAVKGDMVEVSVTDTGIGIPGEKLELIFDSFEQLDGTHTRAQGGTGLGLAITRKLVNLHGGTVEAVSRLNEGSTFRFTLPVTGEAPDPLEENHTISRLQEVNFETPADRIDREKSDSEGFNILIVDDEAVNRQVLTNQLALQNYRITEASGGPEALELLEKNGNRFDLILLDIMMPGMSGYEVCEKLRQHHPVHELPIIFLTARNQVNDLVNAFAAGANDYLSKPVSKNELLSRVNTHLCLLDINRNLEQKVSERTRDLRAVNEKIIRTQKQLVVQEKLASLGTLTAGIAHEIKNPLNFVNNFAELIIELTGELSNELASVYEQLSPDAYTYFDEVIGDLHRNAVSIHKHGTRANHIVQSMMNLARGDRGEWREAELNPLVEEFANMAYHGWPGMKNGARVQLEKQYDSAVGKVSISVQDLSRVIINLVNNALQAVVEKAHEDEADYLPKISVTTRDNEETVTIVIADNGPGIDREHLDKIFTPFFTTRPTGSGNIGLGLYICYDIVVNEHGGELKVDSQPGQGTRFDIILPKERHAS
ncbi:MAG: ATP-binding protein [Acidobacteriota bacterium]|nr:ATP-binding protein [Acidobacteriota bacterium]